MEHFDTFCRSTDISWSTSINMFHLFSEILTRARWIAWDRWPPRSLVRQRWLPDLSCRKGDGIWMDMGSRGLVVFFCWDPPAVNANLLQGAGPISRHCLKRHFNERNASGREVKLVWHRLRVCVYYFLYILCTRIRSAATPSYEASVELLRRTQWTAGRFGRVRFIIQCNIDIIINAFWVP